MPSLLDELTKVLNGHEGGSGTPDFILAEYLRGCLEVFDKTTRARDRWWVFEPMIGGVIPAVDEPA